MGEVWTVCPSKVTFTECVAPLLDMLVLFVLERWLVPPKPPAKGCEGAEGGIAVVGTREAPGFTTREP